MPRISYRVYLDLHQAGVDCQACQKISTALSANQLGCSERRNEFRTRTLFTPFLLGYGNDVHSFFKLLRTLRT